MSASKGKVWLVGAGPGDPGLITVRGLEVLGRADLVLYDALAHPDLLLACPQAEQRFVGKRYGEDSVPQTEITDALIASARAGRRVVRLKGGDPYLFARGSEETEALAAAGVPFEIVPGVTSPVAAAAYAGLSLTHRDWSSSVTFITGHQRAGVAWSAEQWQRLATATDTICVLMGMRRIEEITLALVTGGRAASTPALVVQWGARPAQRVVSAPLGEIAAQVRREGLTNPALIIVGEVVRLRDQLRWYDTQPLFGRRVLVPRAREQAESTARALRERGAEPLVAPLIAIEPPPDGAALTAAVGALATYDWVVFTSANGVARTLAELARQGRDARAFGRAQIAAIGPKTAAALGAGGLRADLVAEEYVGESLATALLARVTAPCKVLLLRALVARDALPDALRAAGHDVEVVAAYRTTTPASSEAEAWLAEGRVDAVLFTSSSTVTSLTSLLGARAHELLAGVALASIGPITSATLRGEGLEPSVTASEHTVSGLLDALEASMARH